MDDEHYMKLAIAQALQSQAAGGAPIGAVMVKEDKVIATGQSLVGPKMDPSAHGETECIRAACKALSTLDLSDCTLYTTLESCSMCLGCAAWAGVSRIVFGAYQEDVAGNAYELKDYSAEPHAQRLRTPTGGKVEVTGGVLRDECKALMANYKNWMPV